MHHCACAGSRHACAASNALPLPFDLSSVQENKCVFVSAV